MPCSDGGPRPIYQDSYDNSRELAELRAKLDLVTRVACEYCTQLEASNAPIPEYAKAWWHLHKIDDARKAAYKAKLDEARRVEAEREELKRATIAKLTPEERAALGL